MNSIMAGNADSSGTVYLFAALFILLLFYAIYFIKMLAQKRRGIQTRQLGKSKERQVRAVEIALSAATFLIVPVQLISILLKWNMAPGGLRAAGAAMGALGDVIFLISVIAMKDSWRAGIPAQDKTALVTGGIYAYSRNPAFLGFDLMYAGILLMYFNPLLLVCTAWVVVMLHLQILQEEAFLSRTFGAEYAAYRKRTGRYLGKRGK